MPTNDYERVEQAILFLDECVREQPDLSAVAAHVGLSEFHFQRLFKRWAGISPKRFLQFLTVEHTKRWLRQSKSVLDATYEAGLSSPSRLHDHFVTVEAVTPGEFKNWGDELAIRFGFQHTPFGECLLALTERGVCGLEFVVSDDRDSALSNLQRRWKKARLYQDDKRTKPAIDRIFTRRNGDQRSELRLFLYGTNFQLKVWQALLRIPPRFVLAYEDVARWVCSAQASRAVGHAIGRNPVAFLIPCHRVIRKIGMVGDYRWGTARKKALLAWEAAQTEPN